MALIFTGNTSSGFNAAADYDTYVTRAGQYVSSDTDAFDFMTFDHAEYLLRGDIFAGDDGIVSVAGAGALRITVADGATISAAGDGIQLFGDPEQDSNQDIINHGSITAHTGEGVDVRSYNSSLVNHGTITAGSYGVYFNGDNNRVTNNGAVASTTVGMGVRGDRAVMTNTGTVTSETLTGLELNGDSGHIDNSGTVSALSFGIDVEGDEVEVVNTGSVTGDIGVRFVVTAGLSGTGSLLNAGLIVGRDIGVDAGALFAANSFEMVNSGEIRVLDADRLAVVSGATADTLRNTGIIDGHVELGDGADVYDGRGGIVVGEVRGGDGDDLYWVGDTGTQVVEQSGGGDDEVRSTVDFALGAHVENLTLLGSGDIDGSGNEFQNVITGNAGDNVLFGNNSRDTIEGGAGADTVDGGRGGDMLYGGAQDDWLAGRSSADYLDGGEGDDFLFGGLGDDSMFGDEGNDTLKGGLGSDTMDGGAGADTFVFTRVADSLGGFSDLIENFEVGADVLDFTGLVSGTLDVNILGGLTGGGQASLRTFENSYGDTIVFVDADGDGSSDMRIEVNMVTGLTESDFAV